MNVSLYCLFLLVIYTAGSELLPTSLQFPLVRDLDASAIYSRSKALVLAVSFGKLQQYETLRAMAVIIDTLGLSAVDIAHHALNSTGGRLDELGLNKKCIHGAPEDDSALLLFDSDRGDNPLNYTIIPREVWKKSSTPLSMRKWLRDTYQEMHVQFVSSSEVKHDLMWVHFKGNYKFTKISSLDSIPVSQYTKPGHMFTIVKHGDNSYIDDFSIEHATAIYIVPATFHTNPIVIDFSNNRNKCEPNCRQEILHYLGKQRSTQIWLQSFLPKLNGDRKHYKPFQIQDDLYDEMLQEYLANRNRSQTESLISAVFNQLEVPTFYVPITADAMTKFTQICLEVVSEWLHVELEDLEVTGRYGVREYRKGAIINWHTDPLDTQPITVIFHLSHAEGVDNDGICIDREDKVWTFEMSELHEDLTLDAEIEEYHLAPGEGIVFESARIPHARTKQLAVDYYGNVFVHIAPKWWKSFVDENF